MGKVGDLSEMFDPLTDWTAHSGIGTVTTLPMTDEERDAARKRPLGFIWEQDELTQST